MQAIGNPYSSIISEPYRVDTVFTIANVDYTLDDIDRATIDGILFDELTIGNASTRTLSLVLKGMPNIPRGAEIQCKQRAFNNTETSPWVPKGTFYISQRVIDRVAKKTTITAYDAMNRADVVFFETGTWTSADAYTVVDLIADHIGVTVSAGTVSLLTNNPIDLDYIPAMGTEGTTEREMLQYLGVLYGGNWTISDTGELTLIPLSGTGDTTTIGYDAQKCENQATLPAADRVMLTNGESVFKAPSNYDELTGTVICAECPYATQEAATRVLGLVSGYVYQPYKASKVYLEPAAGLGDGISIYGLTSVIAKQSMTISNTSPSDLSADYTKQEVDDEYEYRSPVERALIRETHERVSSIEVLDNQIQSVVVEVGGVQTQVTQNAEGIEAVTQRVDESESYLRWDGTTATLSIGESNSPTELQVRPSGFEVVQNGEAILTAENQKVSTTRLEATETLTVGRYQWLDEQTKGYSLLFLQEQ